MSIGTLWQKILILLLHVVPMVFQWLVIHSFVTQISVSWIPLTQHIPILEHQCHTPIIICHQFLDQFRADKYNYRPLIQPIHCIRRPLWDKLFRKCILIAKCIELPNCPPNFHILHVQNKRSMLLVAVNSYTVAEHCKISPNFTSLPCKSFLTSTPTQRPWNMQNFSDKSIRYRLETNAIGFDQISMIHCQNALFAVCMSHDFRRSSTVKLLPPCRWLS